MSAQSPITDLHAIARVFKVDGPIEVLQRLETEMCTVAYRAGNSGDKVGARVLLEEANTVRRCWQEIRRRRGL